MRLRLRPFALASAFMASPPWSQSTSFSAKRAGLPFPYVARKPASVVASATEATDGTPLVRPARSNGEPPACFVPA